MRGGVYLLVLAPASKPEQQHEIRPEEAAKFSWCLQRNVRDRVKQLIRRVVQLRYSECDAVMSVSTYLSIVTFVPLCVLIQYVAQ